MFTQKGGIRINPIYPNAQAAFTYFIRNSFTEVLTYETRGGILFKSKLKAGNDVNGGAIVSPYTSSRSNNPNRPVNFILFKLCLLNRDEEDFTILSRSSGAKVIDLNGTTAKDFVSEIKTQLAIFNDSMDQYLEPICPSIICAKIYRSYRKKKQFLDLFFEQAYDANNPEQRRTIKPEIIEPGAGNAERERKMRYIFEDVLNEDLAKRQFLRTNRDNNPVPTPPWFQYGLIVMEFLQDFVTVSSLIKNPTAVTPDVDKEFYKQLTMYELWRLYNIGPGYLHGDNHLENAMIQTNYDYIKGRKGRVILIDFGATFTRNQILGRENHFNIAQNLQPADNTEMDDVIDTIYNCTTPRFQGYNGGRFRNKNWHSYQWLRSLSSTGILLSSDLHDIHIEREILKSEFSQHILIANLRAAAAAPVVVPIGNFFAIDDNNTLFDADDGAFQAPIIGGTVINETVNRYEKKPNYTSIKFKIFYPKYKKSPVLPKQQIIKKSVNPTIQFTAPATAPRAYSTPTNIPQNASNIFNILDPTYIFTTVYINSFKDDLIARNIATIAHLTTKLNTVNTLLFDKDDPEVQPPIHVQPAPVPIVLGDNTLVSNPNYDISVLDTNRPTRQPDPPVVVADYEQPSKRSRTGGNKTKTKKNNSRKSKKNIRKSKKNKRKQYK